MFKTKPHIIVAITTFDSDALRVSLPPMRRLHQKFSMVIHNDNPGTRLTRWKLYGIRPRGKLYIINSEQNVGEFESRIRIIEYIRDKKIPCDWIIFVDDDDVLIDTDAANVDKNIFAIVQDVTTLTESITDIFKISPTWTHDAPIGKTGPRFDITGTMIRAHALFEFVDFMRTIVGDTNELLAHTKYRMPISTLMWAGLCTFMHVRHPEMSPIYMNRANYVAIKMGRGTTKYDKIIPNTPAAHRAVSDTIKKFTKLVEVAATQNMVAENQ